MRAGDQPVAHRPAVDIGILLQRVGPREGRDRDMAGELDAFARGIDRRANCRETPRPSPGRSAPAGPPACGRRRQSSGVRSVPASVKRTAGKAIAMRLHDVGDRGCLGALAFHEFQPRRAWRRRDRALRPACPRLAAAGRTAETRPPSTVISAPASAPAVRERMVRRDTEPIDGSASPRKPSERMSWMSCRQFRRAVAGHRQLQFVRCDAGPVVDDADQAQPAAGRGDFDPGGAGIERVLDQFLDDARRAFDDLAGGDLVDHRFGKLADRHGGIIGGFGQWRPDTWPCSRSLSGSRRRRAS